MTSPGPTTNPRTCAKDTMDTAPVLSLSFVAADKYERQTAMLAEMKYTTCSKNGEHIIHLKQQLINMD
jgi:hypothetical protein